MPQHRKPARLYFKKSRGWIIIDGTTQRGTGLRREQLREAEKALADYTESHHRIDTRKRDLAEIWCEDVINLYTSDVAPALPSAATIGYQGDALLKFWSGKSLADVKGSTCRTYVKFRTAQELRTREGDPQRFVSAATARQELKLLGRTINHWNKESPLPAVPQVTLPKVVSKRERVLTRNEVARLLWQARKLKFNHVARFILIGVYTGTRHDAILRLRWSAAHTGGHPDLERNILYRRGAGERETSKRRPPAPISRRLACKMAIWKRGEDVHEIRNIIHLSGQALAKMKRAWATVVEKAGLGREVTPHVLRHTCASWLLWEGRTIWEVAGIIGADASTVERVYGHHQALNEERKRA